MSPSAPGRSRGDFRHAWNQLAGSSISDSTSWPVGSEGGLDQAGPEHVLAHVPVQQQPAGQLSDLRVQPDLRTLRDDPRQLAEALAHPVREQLAQSDGAGVDHRREHLALPVRPGQIAQHVHPAVRAVLDAGVQPVLQGLRLPGKRPAGGQLHGQQQGTGEVTDQRGHVRVQRFPVEQRKVEQELRLAAVRREHLGERGGQDRLE